MPKTVTAVRSAPPGRAGTLSAVLLAASVLLIAANLRPAVVAVAPLVDEIRADLGMTSAVAGLVTALPVLCFGLAAPLGARLTRRWGLEATLLVALVVLVLGFAIRLVSSISALLIGSLVAGAAIAIGNTLMPVIVKRDFPGRVGAMTAAYSSVLSGAGALAAALTVPLEQATGLNWAPTLALWGLLAVAAIVLWVPWVVRARRHHLRSVELQEFQPEQPVQGLWRSPLAWYVTLFMGMQSLHFYAFTAWMPTLFAEEGRTPTEAGLLLALAGIVGLITSVITPVLASRRRTQHPLVVALVVFWGVGYLGLILAPVDLAILWMVIIGLGQGVAISLALVLIAMRAPDAAHTSQLSGMAQGVGYCLAALGPFGLGALHDLAGNWTVPLAVLTVLLVPLGFAGLGASRDQHVRGSGVPVAMRTE